MFCCNPSAERVGSTSLILYNLGLNVFRQMGGGFVLVKPPFSKIFR
jgi:hypothetical protein